MVDTSGREESHAVQGVFDRVDIERRDARFEQADFLAHRTRFATRSSTTAGSARVLVSPRLDTSPSAILRRMRRMILPLRVLGRPGANCSLSGAAIGPISVRTHFTSSVRRSSDAVSPELSV